MTPVDFLLSGSKVYPKRPGRPLVTLSYAQSLDGSIAVRRGSPCPLSGSESLVMTHKLRAAHDALLVGIGTVLADNPRLNLRLADGKHPQPVILDTRLRFPLGSRLLNNESLSPWIITTSQASKERQNILEAIGARVMYLPSEDNGWIELNALLKALADSGIDSLMVEGGARVITSFLRKQLVDRIVLTITPTILGGLHAVESPLLSGRGNLPGEIYLPRVKDLGYEKSGADMVIWGTLAWED